MVDPDIPLIFSKLGNSSHPLVHWMVLNIPNGNISLGDELHSYIGPLPPDDQPHYYYYFLFQQPWKLDFSDTEGFYSNCGKAFRGRCVFLSFCLYIKLHLMVRFLSWSLRKAEYPVIAITPRSTLTPSGSTCLDSIYWSNYLIIYYTYNHFSIHPYQPSLLVSPLDGTYCQHRANKCTILLVEQHWCVYV